MNMTVEMYAQAIHRAMKETAIYLQMPIEPLSEKSQAEKPTRS
jgi:hypothetical protein